MGIIRIDFVVPHPDDSKMFSHRLADLLREHADACEKLQYDSPNELIYHKNGCAMWDRIDDNWREVNEMQRRRLLEDTNRVLTDKLEQEMKDAIHDKDA